MKTASMGCSPTYGRCGGLVLATFIGKLCWRNIALHARCCEQDLSMPCWVLRQLSLLIDKRLALSALQEL